MKSINLKESFGDVFKVEHEESHGDARTDDPSLQQIPCQHGHIFPHGGDLLAASTNNSGVVANKLRRMPGVNVHQDGDDGINVVFDVGLFAKVAEVMKPRRRRRLSREHRQRLDRASQPTRFKPVLSAGKTTKQGPPRSDVAGKTCGSDQAVSGPEKVRGNREDSRGSK